jgi:hypothetical protein
MKPAHLVLSSLLLGSPTLASVAVPSPAAGEAPSAGKAASASSKPAAAPKMVLPFIQDDYAKALKEARARKRPLFIETWAPW